MQLVFASNNKNKIREINHILGENFTLLSLYDINMVEDISENESTLEGNALEKPVLYMKPPDLMFSLMTPDLKLMP